MKKLLAMLTTITSLSSITSIILANASASEVPQNKIVNNEIDYLQTNNLENLSRVKRNNNNFNSENSYDKQDLPYPVTTMYTLDWQHFLGHFLYGLLFSKFNRC